MDVDAPPAALPVELAKLKALHVVEGSVLLRRPIHEHDSWFARWMEVTLRGGRR